MSGEKSAIIIKNIVFAILGIASFGCVWFASKNIMENCELNRWMVSSVLVILCFSVCNIGISMRGFEQKWATPAFIALISFGVHFLIIFLMGENTVQTSDLYRAIEQSASPLQRDCEWYRSFTSWSIVPLYYKGLRVVFGTLFGVKDVVLIGVYLNAVYSTLTALNIYFSMILCGKSRRIGFLASMVFTFWPMHLIYSVCPTPEFVNIWLVSLSFLLYLYGFKTYAQKMPLYTVCVVGGASVILAISGFFKSVDKVILIVFFCMGIIWLVKNKKIPTKLFLKYLIISSILYVGTIEVIFAGLGKVYGAEVNRNIMPHYLYIGLAPNDEAIMGVHTKSNGIWYDYVEAYNYDYEKAGGAVMQRLADEINEKGIHIRDFVNKFELTWGEASYLTWPMYALDKENVEIINRANVQKGFSGIVRISYLLIVVFMTYGVVRAMLEKKIDWLWLGCALYILGYMCVLLLSECQPRYKCIVYPYMSMFAAYGIDGVICIMESRK